MECELGDRHHLPMIREAARKARDLVLALSGWEGAKTGNQTKSTSVMGMGSAALAVMQRTGGYDLSSGFGVCPGASIQTYRRMLQNPTIALGLAVCKAPIKASQWSVGKPEGAEETNEAAEQLVKDWILPLRSTILADGLRAIEFGRSCFEIVWGVRDGRDVPVKLKPLLPELCEILIDKNTGAFMGVKNRTVTLTPDECLVISHDSEAGDMNGRSRLENVREHAWWPWVRTLDRTGKYTTKAAGIIPLIRYPAGRSLDATGTEVDNSEIAKRIIERLDTGNGIIMPQEIAKWAEQLIQNGVDPTKIAAWSIEFVEANTSHGDELSGLLGKFESLAMRGLLVPERTAIEGQFGTKAEAGAHGDVAVSIAQDTLDQLIRAVNWHLVDKMLARNFGEEARGSAVVKSAPLVDEDKAFIRKLVETVLVNPANVDLLTAVVDMDAAMDQTGVPRRAMAGTVPNALPLTPDSQVGQMVAGIYRRSEEAKRLPAAA